MNNLLWGLQMTVLGMGLVFALLGLLWAVLHLALRFDRPQETAETAKEPAAPGPSAGLAGGAPAGAAPVVSRVHGLDADLVAAITVATLTHTLARRQAAAPVMRSYWPGSLLYASRWVATGRARQNSSWQRGGR